MTAMNRGHILQAVDDIETAFIALQADGWQGDELIKLIPIALMQAHRRSSQL